MGGGKGGSQTVGYKYFMGWHMILCYGPVAELFRIRVGDRLCYESINAGGSDANITASGQYIVKGKDQLFGGDDREGGVGATAGTGAGKIALGSGILNRITGVLTSGSATASGGDFFAAFGEVTQLNNNYLDTQITGEVPAYRGMMGLIFQSFYFGNNPYIKDFQFEVARYPNVIPAAGAEALIGDDANPAHILWEVLTNIDWGMGYTTSDMNTASFQALSTTLFVEDFGLSLVWNESQSIEDFIQVIMDHINGTMYLDPATGQFTVKLIRDDYVIGSLPIYDESNIVDMQNFSRAGWGETTNEITVIYKDRETAKDIPVTVQDLANIQLQGTTISATRQYPGITKESLAIKLALRDLQTVSSPLAKIKMKVNREAWDLVVGDAFVLAWPKFGITQVVFRVGGVNYGSLKDGHIIVDAIEDAFALPTAEYANPQPSGWLEPRQNPEAITNGIVREMTYWEIVQAVGENNAEDADPLDNAFYLTAAKPNSAQYHYFARSRPNGVSTPFQDDGSGQFAPTGLIDAAMIPAVSSTFNYNSAIDIANIQVGSLMEMNNEIMQIYEIDPDVSLIRVYRGMLDTIPISHALGSRFYANQNFTAQSVLTYTKDDVVDIKGITVAGGGELGESSAPTIVYTFTGRAGRPLAPGNVQVEGLAAFTPVGMTTAVFANLTWKHRNRVLQTGPTFIYQDDVSLGLPAGVDYTLRLYDETDTLVRTVSAFTDDFYDWVDEEGDSTLAHVDQTLNNNFRFELEANESGNISHSIINYAFERADHGYNYGEYYGGFP